MEVADASREESRNIAVVLIWYVVTKGATSYRGVDNFIYRNRPSFSTFPRQFALMQHLYLTRHQLHNNIFHLFLCSIEPTSSTLPYYNRFRLPWILEFSCRPRGSRRRHFSKPHLAHSESFNIAPPHPLRCSLKILILLQLHANASFLKALCAVLWA